MRQSGWMVRSDTPVSVASSTMRNRRSSEIDELRKLGIDAGQRLERGGELLQVRAGPGAAVPCLVETCDVMWSHGGRGEGAGEWEYWGLRGRVPTPYLRES